MKQKPGFKSEEEKDMVSDDQETKTSKSETEVLPDAEIEETDPVSRLEAELTTANDKYLRLYSEFENYKKRVARDRVEQAKMASADILSALISIIDDLERAIKSAEESKDNSSAIEGVKLIYNKIKNFTASKGLTLMESTGKTFDPELHDAIANVPAPAPDLKGKVVEEIEKGYYLYDKVIRHAKVVVGN